jgi:hypothetical protein
MQSLRDKEKRELELAYLSARWAKLSGKDFPSYTDVFGEQKKANKQQTPEELLNKIKALNAKFGGN